MHDTAADDAPLPRPFRSGPSKRFKMSSIDNDQSSGALVVAMLRCRRLRDAVSRRPSGRDSSRGFKCHEIIADID